MGKTLLPRVWALLGVVLVVACGGVGAAKSSPPRIDLAAQLAAMQPQEVSWGRVDTLVARALLQADRQVVEDNLASAPATLAVLLARFDFHLRAGHDTKTRETLVRLCQRQDFCTPEVAGAVASELLERKKWGLAIRVLNACPAIGPGIGQHIVNYVAKTEGDEAADKLLQKFAGGGDEWIGEWVWFRAQRQGADSIFRKLEAAVRAAPASLARAQTYLHAAQREGRHRDVDWMGAVCRPAGAVDSSTLGRQLFHAGAHQASITLVKRSLAMDITPGEARRYANSLAQVCRDPVAELRALARHTLADAYKAIGRPDLAQPVVEELARAERARGRVSPETSRQAGEVQSEGGQRTIERTLKADEKTKADSPAYWLARAEYYAGRKDDAQARAAFSKALSLAPVGPPYERSRLKGGSVRYQVISAYVRYLRSQQQWPDLERLLRAELQQGPYGCDTRELALSMLLHLAPQGYATITHDDEVMWKTLAINKRWESTESSLLDRMLRRCASAQKNAAVSRAEKLCVGTDPSRAVVLGGLFSRYGLYHRAVALLRHAVARLAAPERRSERERAEWALFDAYLNLGRPAEAESLFATVGPRLGAQEEEAAAQLARIAVAAAKVGDTRRAMRLWRQVTRLDATAMHGLSELANAGLREELRRFYEEWRRKDPKSWVPSAALKRIKASPGR